MDKINDIFDQIPPYQYCNIIVEITIGIMIYLILDIYTMRFLINNHQ